MTPEAISACVREALAGLVAAGRLSIDVPTEVHIERPKSREHGDYASNVALLAERFDADNGRIARIILLSTVLAFFTFSGAVALLV